MGGMTWRSCASKRTAFWTRISTSAATRPGCTSSSLVRTKMYSRAALDPADNPPLTDELALLFTGSTVPNSFQTTDRETVEEENEESGVGGAASPLSGAQVPPISSSAARPPSPTTKATSAPIIHASLLSTSSDSSHPLFSTEQLGVDRRLIVNRKRQIKMYRVWMQGKFRKL